jgi:hypothetical protein
VCLRVCAGHASGVLKRRRAAEQHSWECSARNRGYLPMAPPAPLRAGRLVALVSAVAAVFAVADGALAAAQGAAGNATDTETAAVVKSEETLAAGAAHHARQLFSGGYCVRPGV